MSAAVAVIPAGGRGSRIGGDKPTRMLLGRPLIEYPVSAALAAGLSVVVVARNETQLPQSLAALGARIVVDDPGQQHPLLGVITGLRHAAAPIVVIAGDMPLISADTIDALAREQGSVVVADADGRLQPLLARYEPELLDPLTRAADEGRSATSVLLECGVRVLASDQLERFGSPEQLLMDVDTEDDLALATKLLGEQGVR